jgi:DivIVA domain-containing protein
MPEERRMTITSSPHLAPDDVARHTFASVRRGFDPGEVRDYLESIAAGLRGLAERERELLQELADTEVRAANPVLDEPTLTEALGKETARVLHSAHEAAAEMLANAEAEAQRLLGEATDTAEHARSRADTLVAERSAEVEEAVRELRERTDQQVAAALDKARDEVELMAERAREECRAMVEEAQQLRARVLADLSRRRRVLHAQIEQLRAGRERLAQTVQDVRRSVESIAHDVFNAENEARLAAEAAGREAAGRPEERTPEELAAILLADEAEAAAALGAVPDAAERGEGPPAVAPAADEATEQAAQVAASTADGAPPVEEVDALFAKIRAAHAQPVPSEDPVAQPAPESDPGEPGEVPAEVTAEGDADDGPPADRHPMAERRDELLRPIVTALGRRLKRTLQDSQNDLLDGLRSRGATWSSDLLPPEVEHLDRFATSALPALEQAAEAGAEFAATGSDSRPSADALVGIADELAASLVGPLRRRLLEEDGLDGAEESVAVEHVGSAFREWKGERVEGLAADHVVAAFSLGTIAAAKGASGAAIEWIAIPPPGETPCPDCEDNGLNGPQQAGEPFPTGNPHPPAHPGCRCLLVPASI